MKLRNRLLHLRERFSFFLEWNKPQGELVSYYYNEQKSQNRISL
jgi:hypothetical protein